MTKEDDSLHQFINQKSPAEDFGQVKNESRLSESDKYFIEKFLTASVIVYSPRAAYEEVKNYVLSLSGNADEAEAYAKRALTLLPVDMRAAVIRQLHYEAENPPLPADTVAQMRQPGDIGSIDREYIIRYGQAFLGDGVVSAQQAVTRFGSGLGYSATQTEDQIYPALGISISDVEPDIH